MTRVLPSPTDPFSYDGEITEDGLMEFEGKFFKGELTPSLKSEEPSEEDLEEPVKVVKGKSFSKMVIENGQYFWFSLLSHQGSNVAFSAYW